MTRPMLDTKSFVRSLLEEVPELRKVYEDHVAENDELLEHVFMGDVTRFTEEQYAADPNSEILTRLLAFLDWAFTTDNKKVQELISVSFLENLSREEESYSGIKALLSDPLTNELSRYD